MPLFAVRRVTPRPLGVCSEETGKCSAPVGFVRSSDLYITPSSETFDRRLYCISSMLAAQPPIALTTLFRPCIGGETNRWSEWQIIFCFNVLVYTSLGPQACSRISVITYCSFLQAGSYRR